MYRNRENCGNRPDMAAISLSAEPELKRSAEVVRWKSLDALLKSSSADAKKIKNYI